MTRAGPATDRGPSASTVVVDHIGRLYTMDGSGAHGLGVVEDAAIVVENGIVAWLGPRAAMPETWRLADAAWDRIDAGGRAVVPGLIDCHTHLAFCGDRADEFARRARGESYQQIMAAGGGIRSTMRRVRAASVDEIVAETAPRVDALLARGVTTVEIKSGYGLDVESELKMLAAARVLHGRGPVDVVATLLAAHAIPPEYDPAAGGGGGASGFIDRIVRDLLPEVARDKLATACDVFVEAGAFSVDDGRRLLRAAQDLGLHARVHAEQLSHQGGALLAAEIGALSAGHLEHVDAADIAALAKAGVVCEVLSTAQVFLRGQRAIPGRALVDAGCIVAVATDANPGTAMSTDLPLAGGLAVTQCGLTAEEALLGMTAHAARALGLGDRGVLAVGKRGDLVVLQGTNAVDLVYRWSDPQARIVLAAGALWKRADAGVAREGSP